MSVKSNFSLHRTYIIFRSLGLRHLTVTSVDGGQVVGMITRRDLMGFNLEEKLDKAPQNVGRFAPIAKTIAAFRGRPNSSPPLQARHNAAPLANSDTPHNLAYNPTRSGIVAPSVIIETSESHIELTETNPPPSHDSQLEEPGDTLASPVVMVTGPSDQSIQRSGERDNPDVLLLNVQPRATSSFRQSDVDPLP